MKQLTYRLYFLSRSHVLLEIVRKLSPAELVFFCLITTLFVGSSFILLLKVNNYFLVEIPAPGGTFIEGIVGSPRFINPLLAASDADRDLSTLVYSGLMKPTPDGGLTHDLAESHSISSDGLVYHFLVREDAEFHDGTKVTADDILFTVRKAQDPTLKSPKRASWEGVKVTKINDREIEFLLSQPYAPFLENTTLGILPSHKWRNADAEEFAFSKFNTEPIGSGPYKINRIKRSGSGVPEYYELTRFPNYTRGEPNISSIIIRFYQNEESLIDAYLSNEIGALNSITSKGLAFLTLNAKRAVRIERVSLPRIYGVFFNQNQAPVLAHVEVRKALDLALDKKSIVTLVLGGAGVAIDSPIPPRSLGVAMDTSPETELVETGTSTPKSEAIALLEKNGWRINTETGLWEKKTKEGTEHIQFSISTSDVSELKLAAQLIASEWQQIGIKVDVKIFESGDLNQNIIRPRKYDALFFGEIVGRGLDLFAFWHSSQRNDPGLNIALYTNITTDKLLENARVTRDETKRREYYSSFQQEIREDTPAVFVYAPDFTYIVPQNVNGLSLGSVTTASERFLDVENWYIETERVWNIFVN